MLPDMLKIKEREATRDMNENEGQAADGYRCICGDISTELGLFRSHLMKMGKIEPGEHKSQGRVNLESGEITMPPWDQRTPEQKAATTYAKKKRPGMGSPSGRGEKKEIPPSRSTEVLATAQQIRLVPRIHTMDYSPIMRAAQDAAIRFWGWRPEMPFGNFIDTILHGYFKDRGITLAGYILEESEEERAKREAFLEKQQQKEQAESEISEADLLSGSQDFC